MPDVEFREEHHEPHSVAWHKCRADGISGSDIATIMGRPVRYGSRFDLYYAKRHADAHLYADPDGDTEYAYWGTSIEPNIRNRFAHEHPEFTVRPSGTCIRLGAEWRRCNPDGWVYEGPALGQPLAGFEAKNVDSRMAPHWGEESTQGVAQSYYDQIQWCMDVTGVHAWFVAALFGGNTYRELEVEYDEPYAAELRREAAAFWQQVIDGEQPEPDWHPATLLRLKRMHPDVDPELEVEVDADLAGRYRNAVECRKAADRLHKEAANQLRAAMGPAYRAVDPDGVSVATHTISDRAGYTVKPTTIDKLNSSKTKGA